MCYNRQKIIVSLSEVLTKQSEISHCDQALIHLLYSLCELYCEVGGKSRTLLLATHLEPELKSVNRFPAEENGK